MTTGELRVKGQRTLINALKADEGFSAFPYTDTTGHETIGYGRNLTDVGISRGEAEALLVNDITDAISVAVRIFKDFDNLPAQVQHVVIGMIVNLGERGFRSFRKTIHWIETWAFDEAACELLDSKAAKQLPERYKRYANQLHDANDKFVDDIKAGKYAV